MPIKKRENGKVEYEMPSQAPPPSCAEIGIEPYVVEVPTYRGMSVRIGFRPSGSQEELPFADWKFSLPSCFWPAVRSGNFKSGDVIYNNAAVYEMPWSEGLKLPGLVVIFVLRASPAIGQTEGQVTVSVSRSDGSRLILSGEKTMTQKAFVEILQTAADPFFA